MQKNGCTFKVQLNNRTFNKDIIDILAHIYTYLNSKLENT